MVARRVLKILPVASNAALEKSPECSRFGTADMESRERRANGDGTRPGLCFEWLDDQSSDVVCALSQQRLKLKKFRGLAGWVG